MNKIECHNCLSSKRQFYVYTICRHFLCLKCTFCLVNIQANAIRCCYQYTPISEQLKQILGKQIQVRLKTSQNQKNFDPQIKSDFSFKAATVQKNKKYFFADSIKQQQSDDKRMNMKTLNTEQKEQKIQSIYIKDPFPTNNSYSPSKNLRISKQQLRKIQNRIEIKQKQQKLLLNSSNGNAQIFRQNLMNIDISRSIQRQKEIIHQSFKNYHEELKIRQKEAIDKLYQITQNNWKQNEKSQHFTILAQQKQNQSLYIQKIQNQHHLTDKITTKLDHFKNVLKERLIKHYI